MKLTTYQIIKKRIVGLEYEPGALLSEKKLAEEFKISRTPVREALIRLSGEGLVLIAPHTMARVAEVDFSRFRELMELRLILERGLARLAARNAGKTEIKAMEALAGLDLVMDLKSWLELDKKMHEILARAAQNRMLEEQLQSLRNHFERLVRMVGLFSDQLASSLKPAAKALGEGDQTRLEKILSDHVKDQVRLIQKRFTFDLDKIA